MPADPTSQALDRIERSISGLTETVSNLDRSVVRIGTQLEEHSSMELAKFDRVEQDRRELKRDVERDLEAAKNGIHKRIDQVLTKAETAERAAAKAKQSAQAATTRPVKIATGVGTGIGATIVGAALAVWEWLRNGGGHGG